MTRQEKIGVLFVCTGNICRSPTAEGVFRVLVTREGLSDRFYVDSAGTDGYHAGESPDRRSQDAARRRGYDIGNLRARKLQSADFETFDYLLALDQDHHRILRSRCPKPLQGKISLFLDHAPNCRESEVPDPYYGGAQGFEQVLDLIEAGSEGLLDHLCQTHGLLLNRS